MLAWRSASIRQGDATGVDATKPYAGLAKEESEDDACLEECKHETSWCNWRYNENES